MIETVGHDPAQPRVTLDKDRTRAEEFAAMICIQAPSPEASQPGLSLTRNFVWTLCGNVIGSGCQWAVLVLLAKMESAKVVGDFALAAAVAVPIAFLGDFRLRVLFVTDAINKYPFREILGLRFILSCFSLLAILATCGIAGYGRSTTLVTLIVGIAYIVDSISDTYYGRCQRAERMDQIARSVIVRNVLSAIAFTLAVYFTHRLVFGVCGLVLGRSLILLLYDAHTGAQGLCGNAVPNGPRQALHADFDAFRPTWNVRRQLQMLWVALPLAICTMLVSVNGYVPRYLLDSFVGRRDVGLYAAINYIPSGCFLVATALGYAVFARLAKLYAKGDLAGFKRLLIKVAGLFASLGVGGVLLSVIAGKQVLTLVYRAEYGQHADLLRWLMIVGVVNCLTTAMQCGLTAAAEFRVQLLLFTGVTTISLMGSAILIPRLGLIGAAQAALISSIVQLCASTSLMFRTLGKRARELKNMECAQLETALEVR